MLTEINSPIIWLKSRPPRRSGNRKPKKPEASRLDVSGANRI